MIENILDLINFSVIVIALAFMVLDIATGFVAACVNRCIDSTKMKSGLWHKCGFVLAIIFACLCEVSMQYVDLGFSIPMQQAVCIFIIATEIVSILENLAKISPELADTKFMQLFNREEN